MPRFATVLASIVRAARALLAASAAAVGVQLRAAPSPPQEPPEVSVSFREPRNATSYVGDDACQACHQDKVSSYHQTAHAVTSSLPSPASIKGSFQAGANTLRTANPDLYFKMEISGGDFLQTAWLRTSQAMAYNRTERFDIVVGSGRKGQTYLYWDGDQLFQLPVSYWVNPGEWVNSPGFPDGSAHFERPILPRCLECHASSFRSRAPPDNAYDRSSLVLGISCEKCHGPGGEHVALYRTKPPPPTPAESAIVNPVRLPRERQLDVCALCHAGIGEALTPPLSFVPGGVLDQHLVFPRVGRRAHVDVHASQVQLLERSRCYQSDSSMTCTTCHDVHVPQRDLGSMTSRCLKCHQVAACGVFPKLGSRIAQQCIGCHMPLQETEQIVSAANGKSLQPMVRNHQIAIYPDIGLP